MNLSSYTRLFSSMYRKHAFKKDQSEGLQSWPRGVQRIPNQEKELGITGLVQQVIRKLLQIETKVERFVNLTTSEQFVRRGFELIRASKELSRIRIVKTVLLKKQGEIRSERDNLSWGLKYILPSVKQVIRKTFAEKEQYQSQVSSLRYIFTNKQHELLSLMKSYHLIEEKEFVKRIQRQVQEETKQLEKKFSVQTFSPSEITDQVYGELTRRLQLEKERLGY